MLLALRMEEGLPAKEHGPLEAGKDKEGDSLLELPEGISADTLVLTQCDHFQTFKCQN